MHSAPPRKKRSCRFERNGRRHRTSGVNIPRHIAIIMDGNGRWAEARGLPRHAGHQEGVRPVRLCIEESARRGVQALTLFAFSSENWQRPTVEVTSLMQLFLDAMEREVG